jgi:putative redox protein
MTHSDTSTRSVEITRIGADRYKATNARGGATYFGRGGDDPDFTPVELLLAAIAGCSAIDVDLIVGKRATPEVLTVRASGEKVRDDSGNRLSDLRVRFEVTFPEGEGGDAAREMLPRAIEMSRDRLCTVSRTVQLGAGIDCS